MSDWQGSREYQKYLLGRYSKAEAMRRYQNRRAEESIKAQEDCDKCMVEYGPAFVCLPCAEICYEEEERKGERCVCAASLSCMFYGGLATIISSTCLKSSTGLSFGIPVLVIGTLCGMGMCALERGCCQGCCTEDQEPTSSTADTTANLDAAKVTQPGPSTSAISTQPQASQTSPSSSSSCSDSDSESEGSSFSEKKEAGTGI